MSTETTLQTIDWLNLQLNQILCRTDFIDEMIQEEEDGNILIFLEKKLKGLDKQCSDIGHKIDFELKQLSYLEEVP